MKAQITRISLERHQQCLSTLTCISRKKTEHSTGFAERIRAEAKPPLLVPPAACTASIYSDSYQVLAGRVVPLQLPGYTRLSQKLRTDG